MVVNLAKNMLRKRIKTNRVQYKDDGSFIQERTERFTFASQYSFYSAT